MVDKVGARITILLLLTVVALGGVVAEKFQSGELQQELQREHAEAAAYCEQVYGDDRLVQANVVGRHGGLHCLANDGGAHLHDIPEQYEQQALRAERAGRDLGWTPATARQHAQEFRSDRSWFELHPMLAIALVAVGAALVIGVIHRERARWSP